MSASPSNTSALVVDLYELTMMQAFHLNGVEGTATFDLFVRRLPAGRDFLLVAGLATVLAEELDADWSTVRVEAAPSDARLYANLFFGIQGTGGSTAMANSWEQMRRAGATARGLLAPQDHDRRLVGLGVAEALLEQLDLRRAVVGQALDVREQRGVTRHLLRVLLAQRAHFRRLPLVGQR